MMRVMEQTANVLASGQWLTLETTSVALGLLEPETGSALGELLSRRPELAPEKLGPADPPRTPVRDLPMQLSKWAASAAGARMASVELARESTPHLQGTVMLHRDPLAKGKRLMSEVELGYGAEWFAADPARLELLPELLEGLVEVTRAFHGQIGFSLQSWQLRQFWSRRNQAKGFQASPYARVPKIERHLEDVHWVEYFGPAFLAKWGPERLEGLGVLRRSTANGGLIVWATEDPWHYLADAEGIRSYEWKDPFYKALGENTIWHEDFVEGAPGVYLPTLEEHQEVW
jgi:hypothetical protein